MRCFEKSHVVFTPEWQRTRQEKREIYIQMWDIWSRKHSCRKPGKVYLSVCLRVCYKKAESHNDRTKRQKAKNELAGLVGSASCVHLTHVSVYSTIWWEEMQRHNQFKLPYCWISLKIRSVPTRNHENTWNHIHPNVASEFMKFLCVNVTGGFLEVGGCNRFLWKSCMCEPGLYNDDAGLGYR